ncbi:MAG TPA: SfnB family sulfur acquisition oxidoreductase [Chthoniobacterales bacterium]|nr:SfnB family sulfur acquisition oxidoreductase [Chthoniobacterales bacterium]
MAEAQRIKSDEQALEAARLFAKQIRGESPVRDRERRLPLDEIESFSQTGLWGITVPKEYGGPGVSTTTFTEVVAIVSEADASIGQIPQNHYANVEEIRLIGTEAQKTFFFDRILKGERLGNAAVERSGKNVIANQTRLEPDGDGYRLSGEKFYCTGALFAHWVPVRVTNADGKRVLAIVNRHSEGLTVIDDWSSFGQRTTASGTVVLKNVRVSPDQILPSYEAYQRPTTRGPFSQIIHVAIDVGIARAAIADTIDFVKNRSRPWIDANVERASDDPLTIQELGRLQYQLHAAEALMERSALKVDRAAAVLDEETVTAAALAVAEAKIAATEISIQATNKLFELAGTQSTLDKHGLDRHWRNARVHTLHDPVRWKYYALGNYYLNGVPPPRHAWI